MDLWHILLHARYGTRVFGGSNLLVLTVLPDSG